MSVAVVVAAVILLIGLIGCARPAPAPTPGPTPTPPAKKIMVRVTTGVAQPHPRAQAIVWFEEQVKKDPTLSKLVEVRAYPGAALYNDKDAVDAIQLGNLEMAYISPSYLAKYDKTINSIEIPYAIPSKRALMALPESDLGKQIEKVYEAKGFKIVGWGYASTHISFCTPERVVAPEDIAGKKVRGSNPLISGPLIEAAGAIFVPLPFAEVASALASGMIWGVHTSTSAWLSIRESVPFFTMTAKFGPRIVPYVWIANKDWWEKLPADVREGLHDLIRRAVEMEMELQDKDDEEIVKKYWTDDPTKPGVYVPPDEVLKKWKDIVMEKAYPKYEETFGRELIDRVKEFARRYE